MFCNVSWTEPDELACIGMDTARLTGVGRGGILKAVGVGEIALGSLKSITGYLHPRLSS